MKNNLKTIFRCQNCGHQAHKWMGKCPGCNQWHTFVEETQASHSQKKAMQRLSDASTKPIPIDSIEIENEYRFSTHIKEFDRVLGGGLVPGSLILIGGDPGIGKSTLMLQVLHGLACNGKKVLYVSGEESVMQIKLRSKRLSAVSHGLLVVSEIDIYAIIAMIKTEKPDVVVIDSIQTMFNPELTSAPGSVSQVRELTVQLMLTAKKTNIPVLLTGHVTKDGSIAGPRLLEHMVDTVLYFEGERNHVFRILRTVKNRFGSTNEIGVFEMNEHGLEEVANPSAMFLSERPENSPGSVVVACIEGTRPVLVELQALTSRTSFGNPRRTVLGIEHNKLALLVAVMEKKLAMQLMGHDIFINVAGGVRIEEPAVDLAIISAVASSFLDKPVLNGTVVLGEIGLTGEIRAVSHTPIRITEAGKMGFNRCILPESNIKRLNKNTKIKLIGVKNVSDAIDALF